MAKAAKRISNNKKRKVAMLLANAEQAVLAGRRDICEAMCREIERLWPGNPDLMNVRGVMAARDGDPDAAAEWFRKATQAAPRRFEFHKNLAAVEASRGRREAAAEAYRAALALNERSVEALLGLAKALMDVHDYEQARQVLLRGVRLHPRHPDILFGLSAVHYHLRDDQIAMHWADRALELHPNAVPALMQKANLLRDAGDFEACERLLRRVLETEPDHAVAAFMISQIKRFEDSSDPDIAMLRRIHANASEGSEDRKSMCFALGRALEAVGEYEQAFALLEEGNAICRARRNYDSDAELAHLEAVMAAWTPEAISHVSGSEDDTPIFIVGMPRCGSTLVEQILAAHPEVEAQGEWQGFERVLSERQTSDAPLTLEQVTSFGPDEWRTIGECFVTKLRQGHGEVARITDKTLTNIRLIGAIHCALPKAKIIHVRRHPLDACWSLFKADLEGWEHGYIYSLGEIGYRYRAYLRLMDHWRRVLPEGVMLDLDYEALVADLEGQTRRLLKFCGLPWDDACLAFQRAKTVVRTSSVGQVRRGIYRDAVGRWKHYERHLEPLTRILKDELAAWSE